MEINVRTMLMTDLLLSRLSVIIKFRLRKVVLPVVPLLLERLVAVLWRVDYPLQVSPM